MCLKRQDYMHVYHDCLYMVTSVCLKQRLSSSSNKTKLIQYLTERRLWMFLYDGAKGIPFMYILIGIDSPLSGHPSITSYFTKVSVSVLLVVPVPKVSFLTKAISILLILILTRWKLTRPIIMSFKWQKPLLYSKSICKQSSIPTSIFIGITSVVFSTSSSGNNTAKSDYLITLNFLATTTLTKYLTLPAIPLKVSYSFQKLGNLNLKVLFSTKIPAGSSSF